MGKINFQAYLELPAAEISAATHCGGNSRCIAEHQPQTKKNTQPKQKRRNIVCFPGISAAFPPISAAFPPISAANRGVEKTENKFCRNSQKTPQIRKNCRKSKKGAFFDLRQKFLPQRISRYPLILCFLCRRVRREVVSVPACLAPLDSGSVARFSIRF